MNSKELKWDILENILETTGFFAVSRQTWDNKTKTLSEPILRTEWEEGYNEGVSKICERFFMLDEAFENISEEQTQKIIKLKENHGLYFTIKDKKLSFHINCNDLFYWACSDCEPLLIEELDDFYNACYDKQGNSINFGSDIYVCKKRKMQPQVPMKELMVKSECWTDELESLEAPGES